MTDQIKSGSENSGPDNLPGPVESPVPLAQPNASPAPEFDVMIVGAGPAGATCGAVCAEAGLRTLIVEKTRFPREKVCGDCINPGCWPVLERLGVSREILALPHSRITSVDFVDRKGRLISVAIGSPEFGEMAIKRSLFDKALLDHAVRRGATVVEGAVLQGLSPGWTAQAGGRAYSAKVLVAADGRNSTVARLLGLAPALVRDRVAMQTHIPSLRAGSDNRIVLWQRQKGYCGTADLGGGQLNICLVSWPESILSLKEWASATYSIPPEQAWRTITPLVRAPVAPAHPNLLFVGDAARVVEPFTGEGIYYALSSGELAGKEIVAGIDSGDFEDYREAHAQLYRGRLWINRLARLAMVYPLLGDAILGAARWYPDLLRNLTGKVIGLPQSEADLLDH